MSKTTHSITSAKPKRPAYPRFTVPIEFEVTMRAGWKSGALAMTIGGGDVEDKGKKIGRITSNAFSAAPVIGIEEEGGSAMIQANAIKIFEAVHKAYTEAVKAGRIPNEAP
jgi:hypothetical protein